MIRLFVFSPLCVGPNATLIPHDAPGKSWNEPLGEMSSAGVVAWDKQRGVVAAIDAKAVEQDRCRTDVADGERLGPAPLVSDEIAAANRCCTERAYRGSELKRHGVSMLCPGW